MGPSPRCRCGYANAPAWPRCILCGRSLVPAATRARHRPRRADASAVWAGPVLSAGLVAGGLWGTREPDVRTGLLVAAAVAANAAIAVTGAGIRLATRAPVPVPVAAAAPVPRRDRLTDAELVAALAAW